jgi:hypothetical protein
MRRINKEGTSKSKSHRHLGHLAMAILCALLSVSGAVAAEPTVPMPAHRTLVISVADRKLALVEDGRVAKVYAIAVGKQTTPSPTGELRIVNKVISPTYYRRGVVIGPGKSNPLGPRWIGLSLPGYGIHGTNEPHSIGKAASHGCFRMRAAEVEELFTLVQVGDAVEIHRSRDEVVSRFLPDSVRQAQPTPSAAAAQQKTAVVSAPMAGEI